MKAWLCHNCGHVHPATESLEELGFTWLDENTSKVSCQNCSSYTIQQPYTFDDKGLPIAGQFLMVTTKNTIKKRGNNNGPNERRKNSRD